MRISITLDDINALGEAWNQVKDRTYGKQTTAVYRGLRPFLELADDYRKARKNYIREHADDDTGKIERFQPMEDQNGEELTDEMKEQLGVPETDEWREYQQFLADLIDEEHTFEVTPVLEEKEANKLTPNQQRVFDVLGLLVQPKEKNADEEDDE